MTLKSALPPQLRRQFKVIFRVVGKVTASARMDPNFLIVGAKRGGTTSLWNYLLRHPQVLPMFPAIQHLKSSHYFTMHYDRGPGWYRGFFPLEATRSLHGRHGPVVSGEANPYYLFDPRVAGRISNLLPTVKIIIMLRDPVERAYSHHRERVHEGVENLSFEEALEAEAERLQGEVERAVADPGYYSRSHDWFSYRSRGEYTDQVRRYLDLFPAKQVLVIQSEDFYEAPQLVYDNVTRFIGIHPQHLSEANRFNYHPHPGMSEKTRDALITHFRPHNQSLYELLGRELRWPL